jgi:hypothetical protein
MKRYIILIIVVAALCSCDKDIYDNIKEMVNSEKVYPVGYKQEDVRARSGDERVEIDLYSSRLSAAEMAELLPQAKRTVVEYNNTTIVFDSVYSWVNIPNLTIASTYHFIIYTENEWGDRSIPVDIRQKPFTSADKAGLAFTTSVSAVVNVGIVNIALAPDAYTYCGLQYSYTDKDNVLQQGSSNKSMFFVNNLPSEATTPVSVSCYLLPKDALDTIWVNSNVSVRTTSQQAFDDYLNETTPFPTGAHHYLTAAAPCYIRAADFDLGGEGKGYHEGNNHGTEDANYRNTGGDIGCQVGIWRTVPGCYGITWCDVGDWAVYTLEVQDPGEYTITFSNFGNESNGNAYFTIDLLNYWGTVRFPVAPASWAEAAYTVLGSVYLTAGPHKLKWYLESGNVGFLGFEFTKVE